MSSDIDPSNANELNLDDMEAVVGGKTNDAVHDLKNFVNATVSVPSGTYLVMQKAT